MQAFQLFPAILIMTHGAAAQTAGEPKPPPANVRVKVIKVWASDAAGKDEASKEKENPKDELKEYRKLLETETKKRHFTIEGKPEIQDAIPGKTLLFSLPEDYKLEITQTLEGEGEGKLVLKLLKKGKAEKRGYKISGNLPIIYCTPIRQEGRTLVLITQKVKVTPKDQQPK